MTKDEFLDMCVRFSIKINKLRKEISMYDNSLDSIKKAQNGDKEELWKLMRENNRINLEHSKKIFRKRI